MQDDTSVKGRPSTMPLLLGDAECRERTPKMSDEMSR